MKRRAFIGNLGIASLAAVAGWRESISPSYAARTIPSSCTDTPHRILKSLTVTLPNKIEPLPYESSIIGSRPAFSLRGIKGWGWSPEQYLAEIPVMARYRLNFLMNCYSSLWDLGPHGTWGNNQKMNFWYKPLSPSMQAGFQRVIRSCQQHGLIFCFSVNPNLRSDRPFDYTKAEDFDALWRHYEWSQGLGVTWFNISLDDIHRNIDAAGQARLLNKILKKLRDRDPKAQLTFCPTWYAGTGKTGVETQSKLGGGDTPGVRYTRTLAKDLHPEIFLFWTGPEVCSITVNRDEAKLYKSLCGHRILLWDNYPVNDQAPTLHLGPLMGRSKDLYQEVDGYMSNAMAYANIANQIPMLTIADYSWNPAGYDPIRSIGQSILHLGATPGRRITLKHFVELYPGRLWDNSQSTAWNSLLVRFHQVHMDLRSSQVKMCIASAEEELRRIDAIYSDSWGSGAEILKQNIKTMNGG